MLLAVRVRAPGNVLLRPMEDGFTFITHLESCALCSNFCLIW